jgi:hypothetical protein
MACLSLQLGVAGWVPTPNDPQFGFMPNDGFPEEAGQKFGFEDIAIDLLEARFWPINKRDRFGSDKAFPVTNQTHSK